MVAHVKQLLKPNLNSSPHHLSCYNQLIHFSKASSASSKGAKFSRRIKTKLLQTAEKMANLEEHKGVLEPLQLAVKEQVTILVL